MKLNRADWTAIILTVILSVVYWSGIPAIPFHPDESTQIFMSGDTELFIENPLSLSWSIQKTNDPRQNYRLLDAPLTRDLIAFGRAIVQVEPTAVDWNWSGTWSQNEQAGALPSTAQLLTARFSVAWLFPFTLILMYLIGKKAAGPRFGLLALVALAGNALVLLHTRRAMAESDLLFTTLLALWGLIFLQKRAWLAAIPVALALAAKQTSLALVLTGLVWITIQFRREKRILLQNLSLFLAILLAITFLINPFLWSRPVDAALASFVARQDLTTRQVNEFQQSIPSLVLNTVPERALGMIANLYFTPLQFNEVGNYLAQTQSTEAAYLANPLNTLLRSFPAGMILFFLSIAGFIFACIKIVKNGLTAEPGLSILILTTVLISLTIILTIPLSFQRYIIPLVPLTTFWIVYPLDGLLGLVWKRVSTKSRS
jgi:4-amino-4-deoxy-L-arabinose transferase-like glycosyltransferase